MALEDLAPRIRELRAQIEALKHSRADLERQGASKPIQASKAEIQGYVADLQGFLERGSLFERKSFLRSFIKRIVLDRPNGGTIEYTLPLVPGKTKDHPELQGGPSPRQEVLSIEQTGGDGEG